MATNGHEKDTELAIRTWCDECPRETRLKGIEESIMELRLEQAQTAGAAKSQARNVTIIVAAAAILGLGVQVLTYLDRHSQPRPVAEHAQTIQQVTP